MGNELSGLKCANSRFIEFNKQVAPGKLAPNNRSSKVRCQARDHMTVDTTMPNTKFHHRKINNFSSLKKWFCAVKEKTKTMPKLFKTSIMTFEFNSIEVNGVYSR